MNHLREAVHVVTAHRQHEGGGFVVRRPFPGDILDFVDPFLLLDEMGPADYAPGEALGAPDHPHRGFETVTYLLAGEMEQEDSEGQRGALGPGDVQWMTAGSGVVHSEMPSKKILRDGGRLHGFQLWVNLPKRDKMMDPRYQEVPAARIPKAASSDGKARVAVLAGEALGVRAVIETRTPILYHDWTLEPGADVTASLPDGFDAFAYVFGGEALVGGHKTVDGEMALLGPGDGLRLACASGAPGPARLLLVGGAPLREPVARWGPFVMNTEGEIQQALLDFQSGRMGRIGR